MDVAQPSGQQGQAEAVSMTEHVQDGQEQVVDPTAQYVLGPDGAYYHHQQLHVGAHAVDDQHQRGDISNLDTGGTWHQQPGIGDMGDDMGNINVMDGMQSEENVDVVTDHSDHKRSLEGGDGQPVKKKSKGGGRRGKPGDADAVTAATLEQQILEEDYNKMMQAKEAGKCMEVLVNHFHRTLEPKTVELPDSATVRDLKRHLARIDFNGKAYPENTQELQILVPGQNTLATIADFDRNGEEMTLVSYGFQPGAPCTVWMMVIAPGAARRDNNAVSSPVPGQSRPPNRPSRSKGGLSSLGVPGENGAGDGQMDDLHALQQQQYEGYLQSPEQTAEQKEKERRSSKRWSAAEIEQLIAGVELFNFGHWAAIKQHYGFDLRTPVDLKDKWRNLENAVRHNKPMRGVDLSRTERLRIMKCFEVHQQSKTGVSDVSMPPHIV